MIDHTIGHAYFMSLENLETKKIKKQSLKISLEIR